MTFIPAEIEEDQKARARWAGNIWSQDLLRIDQQLQTALRFVQ